MAPIGILGLVGSIAAQAVSTGMSAKANKDAENQLKESKTEQDRYYLTEMNQDPTKRADNAAYLTQLDLKLKEMNKRNAAKNKITGATQEQVIAQQGNNANAYADVVSRMHALSAQRRDALGKEKMQSDMSYRNNLIGIENAKQQNYAALASNAATLGASAIEVGGLGKK